MTTNVPLSSGLTGITRGPADLIAPETNPDYRYGLAFPFQVAPGRAALFVNIRVAGAPIEDYEYGNDILVFDDLASVRATGAMPLSRNRSFRDPESGQMRTLCQLPVLGGFVPAGARLSDGRPHPHAGTGFGLARCFNFPMTSDGLFSWSAPWIDQLELHQLAWDGSRVQVTGSETFSPRMPLAVGGTEWVVFEQGMSMAIPDGEAMLLPVLARTAEVSASGVSRWERRDGAWRPVDFAPVTPAVAYLFQDKAPDAAGAWAEPSLIRDTDGSLLFHARGFGGPPAQNLPDDQAARGQWPMTVRIWRSGDGGRTWCLVMDMGGLKREGPATLNRALDGTPYLAANFPRIGRDILCLWPLNEVRDGVAGLVVARDMADELGEPPGAADWYARRARGGKAEHMESGGVTIPDRPNRWWADHAVGATLQLADGQWHHVLAYRVLTASQVHHAGTPMPQTGAYLEEVFSRGPARPAWNF